MDLFVARLKLSIVKYSTAIASSHYYDESVVTAVVGSEYEWCKHEVFVSGFSELLLCERKYNRTLHELREKELLCKNYEKDAKMDAEVIDELRSSQRNKQHVEIIALRKLVADMKSQVNQEQENYKECREQLGIAQGKLIEFETYIQSDRGHIAMKLEEELALAKLRIAELESEKDEWHNDTDDSCSDSEKENVQNQFHARESTATSRKFQIKS
jgi:hypothetical protein